MNCTLHIIEAKNLINTGSVRTSDPFVRVTVNEEVQKSSVIHNTLNPRFDHKFYFKNVPLDAPVQIEILDKNLIKKNRFMAQLVTNLSEIRNNPRSWWNLVAREGSGTLGSLYIEAEFPNLGNIVPQNLMQGQQSTIPQQQSSNFPQQQSYQSSQFPQQQSGSFPQQQGYQTSQFPSSSTNQQGVTGQNYSQQQGQNQNPGLTTSDESHHKQNY